MKFLLLIYGDETKLQEPNPQRMAAYVAYTEALRQAGVSCGGNRLQPRDGPFSETKEVLGGYYLSDVLDLHAGLAWAARCPGAALGSIEVRPLWEAG